MGTTPGPMLIPNYVTKHPAYKCEYCGRKAYGDETMSCKGCGASAWLSGDPVVILNTRQFQEAAVSVRLQSTLLRMILGGK
jgi:hypothetical protein